MFLSECLRAPLQADMNICHHHALLFLSSDRYLSATGCLTVDIRANIGCLQMSAININLRVLAVEKRL